MLSPTLFGGRPGTDYDAQWWRTVHALFEECFPGVPAGIARADALGARWAEVSTPFVAMQGGRALAHVGVIEHPVMLNGEKFSTAGIHAVCTTSDQRRKGWARRLLSEALAWSDARHSITKLHTDVPAVYEPHGFRAIPRHRFIAAHPPAGTGPKRLLQPETHAADARLLGTLLARRIPPSNRFATADTGWLDTIVASLSGALSTGFWLLEDFDAIVVTAREETATLILDVIAAELPPAGAVVSAASSGERQVIWTFSPELLDTAARPITAPTESGVFMVRGDWPVRAPFGISPLWEH